MTMICIAYATKRGGDQGGAMRGVKWGVNNPTHSLAKKIDVCEMHSFKSLML